MAHSKVTEIVNYLVAQGVQAIQDSTEESAFHVDYVGIFARSNEEFEELLKDLRSLGTELAMGNTKNGSTFKLERPIATEAGEVAYVKIRQADPTRPQRGAPDFSIGDYFAFKEKYLSTSGRFTLMVKKDFEMVELKGVDVLVYFPSKLSEERQQSNAQ